MMDDLEDLDDFDNGVMNEVLTGHTSWGGTRTKYFAAVMIPRTREAQGVTAIGTERDIRVDGNSVNARTMSTALNMQIPSVGTVSDSYTIYVGPIHYGIMKDYNVGLEELTDLGWVIIKPFSIAIIWLLPKIYNVFPNYGVVVLIFALLVKIIIYPLSRKQTIAMTKMKELQPKMKAIQEKYKNDPAKLNKETMKMYKEAGANPLSGCLPLLPQMPLFFALFTVFRSTIEFRGAYFVGWITDLSVPDPLYILPIIMVVTMFIQQKMTMSDPKQKMLMYMMPLFFGWLFMNFPAGLVLYWTGFNVLSLVETVFIRKKQLAPQAVVIEDKK
jgi:YidC/Oxa1 family membrane protein insertase